MSALLHIFIHSKKRQYQKLDRNKKQNSIMSLHFKSRFNFEWGNIYRLNVTRKSIQWTSVFIKKKDEKKEMRNGKREKSFHILQFDRIEFIISFFPTTKKVQSFSKIEFIWCLGDDMKWMYHLYYVLNPKKLMKNSTRKKKKHTHTYTYMQQLYGKMMKWIIELQ